MSVIAKANVKLQISDALDKLSITYKQWMRLQKMTEEKLYKLLDGCLQLCYVSRSTEAHMSALKKQCGFKWGRNTKLTVLVTKCVFGADTKQVHNYAKALEIAIEEGVGTAGEADMITWLRGHGGISGVVRGKESKVGKRSNIIELERAYTIRVGRDAEKYGSTVKFKFDVSAKFIDKLRTDDVVLLCKVDRKSKQLAVYAVDEDGGVADKYYEELGKNILLSEDYAKYKHKLYDEQRLAEELAEIDVNDKLHNIFDEMLDEEQIEIAA
jgi:hypothetical protein